MEISKYELRKLLETKFNCPRCTQAIEYKDLETHIATHSSNKFECPSGCDNTVVYDGKDDLLDHMKQCT